MAGLAFDYRPNPLVSLRAGPGMMYFCFYGCGAFFGVFGGVSGLFGTRSHKVEVGIEYTKFFGDDDMQFFSPLVGYRYQPPTLGLFFRATLQVFTRVNDGDFLPWPGLGLGTTW
jgi:hypothetical protein